MKYYYVFGIASAIFLINVPSVFGVGNETAANDLINSLMKTGLFTEDEAKNFVSNNTPGESQEIISQQVDSVPIKDKFNVDVILSKGKPSPIKTSSEDRSVWYELVNNNQLDISNSSIICPSNQCKMTGYSDRMIFISSDDYMALAGNFDLIDDQSNGQFNPKKQKLIEQMNFDFTCNYQDIQEDAVKKTTKYICSDPQDGSIRRTFNQTSYPYKFTATFELPSRNLVINATEQHEYPYIVLFGSSDEHTVFRNNDGKIEVK